MTAKLFIPRKNFLDNLDFDAYRLPPDVKGRIAQLAQRFNRDELANYLAIERWANNLSLGVGPVFDFNFPLIVATSDFWPAPVAATFTLFSVRLVHVATTTTTVALLLNGTTKTSFTIAANTTSAFGVLAAALICAAGDGVQAQITGPGATGSGLTVALA